MSRRARGLVAEVWSRPNGWTFNVDTLHAVGMQHAAVEGHSALRVAFAEAKKAGYFVPVHDLGDGGWQRRWTLHRAAAPDWNPDNPFDDFVFIPWEVSRDGRLSYRARGLLAEVLAGGATLAGVTVAVHRGGLHALARRKPDGKESTTTAFGELLTVGYAHRERLRGDDGRLSWRLTFRTSQAPPEPILAGPDTVTPAPDPAPEPPAGPVENPETGSSSSDEVPGESSQVGPTVGFPSAGFHRRVPAPYKESVGDSAMENEEPGDRSDRSVHVGDAHASGTPQAANNDREDRNGTDGDDRSGPVRPSDGPGGPKAQRGGEARDDHGSARHRRSGGSTGRPAASETARQVLAGLPPVFRDGARPWVLAGMARWIDSRLLFGTGRHVRGGREHGPLYSPAQITAAAYEVAKGLIGDLDTANGHFRALDQVRAVLRTGGYLPLDRLCTRCRVQLPDQAAGLCSDCDPDMETLAVIDCDAVALEDLPPEAELEAAYDAKVRQILGITDGQDIQDVLRNRQDVLGDVPHVPAPSPAADDVKTGGQGDVEDGPLVLEGDDARTTRARQLARAQVAASRAARAGLADVIELFPNADEPVNG